MSPSGDAGDRLKSQLAAIQAKRHIARRKAYRRSRLERYRAELMMLADAGASSRELALWLREYKRVKIHWTTVNRMVSRWRKEEG